MHSYALVNAASCCSTCSAHCCMLVTSQTQVFKRIYKPKNLLGAHQEPYQCLPHHIKTPLGPVMVMSGNHARIHQELQQSMGGWVVGTVSPHSVFTEISGDPCCCFHCMYSSVVAFT